MMRTRALAILEAVAADMSQQDLEDLGNALNNDMIVSMMSRTTSGGSTNNDTATTQV